jgi:hemerythrin-like domain-containing protein
MTSSTHSTTTPPWPAVHEMVVIHRFFRRELAAVPALVRTTAEGDLERAAVVGEHVDFVLTSLHVHHTTEDELLWPKLLERAPLDAELVHTMERQHHAVEAVVAQAEDARATWTARPTRADGERLAVLVEQLRTALVEHLDLEEAELLPVVEQHLSGEEWAELAEHGKDATPRRQLPLLFGAFLEDADEEEREQLLSGVPQPIRFFLRTAGAWQYRRYINRVRAA